MITQVYGNKIGISNALRRYLDAPLKSIEGVMASNEITRRIHESGPLQLPVYDEPNNRATTILIAPAWTRSHGRTWRNSLEPTDAEIVVAHEAWKKDRGDGRC